MVDINEVSEEPCTSSLSLYLRDIGNTKILTREEELYLVQNLDNEDNRKRLTESVLKFGVLKARVHKSDAELLDAIQYGNVAVLNSLDKYDIAKQTRFITYIGKGIKNEIRRGILQGNRNIRISSLLSKKIIEYKNRKQELELRLGREVSSYEVVESLGMNEEDSFYVLTHINGTASIEEIMERETFSSESVLIDTSELVDKIIDKSSLIEELKVLIKECHLKKVEVIVLIMFFGLFGMKKMTLEEISKLPVIISEMGSDNFDRRRIHQIKDKAIEKLRRSRKIENFAIYMADPDLSLSRIEGYRKKSCARSQTIYNQKIRNSWMKQKR